MSNKIYLKIIFVKILYYKLNSVSKLPCKLEFTEINKNDATRYFSCVHEFHVLRHSCLHVYGNCLESLKSYALLFIDFNIALLTFCTRHYFYYLTTC